MVDDTQVKAEAIHSDPSYPSTPNFYRILCGASEPKRQQPTSYSQHLRAQKHLIGTFKLPLVYATEGSLPPEVLRSLHLARCVKHRPRPLD